MPTFVLQNTPGTPDPGQSTAGTGSTEASDLTEVQPTKDAFVCAIARPANRVTSKGIRIRISTAGTVIEDATYKATLKVIGENGNVLAGPLAVCDFHAATLNSPAAGDILATVTVSARSTAYVGEKVELVWNESGTLGDGGTRPYFQLLSWGFEVVEDSLA